VAAAMVAIASEPMVLIAEIIVDDIMKAGRQFMRSLHPLSTFWASKS